MPSLANCVDLSTHNNFTNRSKLSSEANIRLPTIHKQQPKLISEVLQ